MAFQPDIVLSEKNIPAVALDLLRKGNVTVVLNIKPALLERIARATLARVLPVLGMLKIN